MDCEIHSLERTFTSVFSPESLSTDLIEVWIWLGLSYSVEVLHVDELEVVGQARVGHLKLGQLLHMGQVPQMFVAPVVQVTQAEG